MDFSDPTQPNVEAQLSLPLGVPAGKTKKKISAAAKRVRSPASEKESEAILARILEHVKNVQNDAKQPALDELQNVNKAKQPAPDELEDVHVDAKQPAHNELQALLAQTYVEDSPLADASVALVALTGATAEIEADSPTTEKPRVELVPIGVDGSVSDGEDYSNEAPPVGSEVESPRAELPGEHDSIEARQTQSAEESFAPDSDGSSRLESEADSAKISPTTPDVSEIRDDVLANAEDIVTPSDGIEILVRMAKNGELDPKAVDIIDVTDRFLKLIAAAPKENLRQSGKILFHACVLLRMKADALLSYSTDDDDDQGGDDFLDFEDGSMDSGNIPRQITFADLERAIVRKTQRRRVRPRPVTLDDLIEALREAERIEQVRADKKPKARIDLAGQHSVEGMDDLLDLAHDEDIETTIDQVEQLLARILKFGENIELMKLVSTLGGHNDWVDAFLASLFLSNAGKIMLEQSEFYGPLYIALCGGQPSVANA